MSTTPRPLRRLRRVLTLLAGFTVLSIAAAFRLEAAGRAIAAVAALAGLVAWLAVLEQEGRTADRLESRSAPKAAARRHVRRVRARRPDRRAA